MNDKDFNEVVSQRVQKIQSILQSKAVEYASDGDRLANFEDGARMHNITRERALNGMMLKHEVSVQEIIKNIDRGILPSVELLEEKIGDNINYLILLEASIKDKLCKLTPIN